MSDCRFGVSPVNYPDPDPDHVEPSPKVRQVFFKERNDICEIAKANPKLKSHPSTQVKPLSSNITTL